MAWAIEFDVMQSGQDVYSSNTQSHFMVLFQKVRSFFSNIYFGLENQPHYLTPKMLLKKRPFVWQKKKRSLLFNPSINSIFRRIELKIELIV